MLDYQRVCLPEADGFVGLECMCIQWFHGGIMVFYTEYLVGFKQQYEMGEFHSHENTPIAGWFISWKIPKKNGWFGGIPISRFVWKLWRFFWGGWQIEWIYAECDCVWEWKTTWSYFSIIIWLVVWNFFSMFPYIGNNHPLWLWLIFFRGVG